MSTARSQPVDNASLRIAVDVAIAVGLALAVSVVVAIDGRLPPPPPREEPAVPTVVVPPPPIVVHHQRALRIGVTPDPAEFDDMAKLLDTLGEGYKYRTFPMEQLGDAAKIAEYDVIFLCCSCVPTAWVADVGENGVRANTQVVTLKPEIMKEVDKNLRAFVGKGGTLYASDLHFNRVATAFKEYVDFGKADVGKVQNVTAEVVDLGLREIIGPQIKLQFDQPGWRPAAFGGDKVVTYMRGEFQSADGKQQTAPFLVKFPYKDGTVIFTSFHNEKQHNETEMKLLRYLVFAAVTAEADTRVAQTMVKLGFKPAKNNLFSASSPNASVTQSYDCTQKGTLQFVLAIPNAEAKLKLTVVGPDGRRLEQEGTGTVTVEVPDAAVGAWKYTVTALEIPNDNLPFTVTVGQK
jgi:hypothetical protein